MNLFLRAQRQFLLDPNSKAVKLCILQEMRKEDLEKKAMSQKVP
jgi:hypothetical protein